jgi:prepilin-type N-terminal cleavage/methylation domain-containing protein
LFYPALEKVFKNKNRPAILNFSISMDFQKRRKGFTLLELLLVMAIIGTLIGISLILIQESKKRARDLKRISDITQIKLALQTYYEMMGKFPNCSEPTPPNPPECEPDPVEGGWDVGNISQGADDNFILALVTKGIIGNVPIETFPGFQDEVSYRYFYYSAEDLAEMGGICEGKPFYILAAKLEKPQENYNVQDEVDPCYSSINSFWEDSYWYVIMERE